MLHYSPKHTAVRSSATPRSQILTRPASNNVHISNRSLSWFKKKRYLTSIIDEDVATFNISMCNPQIMHEYQALQYLPRYLPYLLAGQLYSSNQWNYFKIKLKFGTSKVIPIPKQRRERTIWNVLKKYRINIPYFRLKVARLIWIMRHNNIIHGDTSQLAPQEGYNIWARL